MFFSFVRLIFKAIVTEKSQKIIESHNTFEYK